MSSLLRVLMAMATCVGAWSCDNSCRPTGGSSESVVFSTAGGPTTVTMLLPLLCGSRSPTNVATSVLDADSMTVEHTRSAAQVSSRGVSATITFTPPRPGPYHLTARFEPSFGLAQLDVWVASDMRAADSVTVPQTCTRGDLTPSGLALCRTATGTDVFRGADRVHTFSGPVARAGSALWAFSNSELERWAEDGGALERVASTPVATGATALLPGEDDIVLVFSSGGVRRWVPGNAVESPNATATGEAVWRNGEELVTLKRQAMGGWCVVPLDGGRETCAPQSTQNMTLRGLDPDGLWTQEETMMGSQVVLLNNRTSRILTLPEGWRVASAAGAATWDTGAWLQNDAGIPDAGLYVLDRVSSGALSLSRYEGTVRSVTSTCVMVDDSAGARFVKR